MFRNYMLNLVVGLAGGLAVFHFVAEPLYRLLHLGVRPHGSLADDTDFYYALVAVGMIQLGQSLGMTCCIAGITCALGTAMGFGVEASRRRRARVWFWYLPVLWFSVEIMGRYQVQRWYADHGVLFPLLSFLRDFAPHLWWLGACGLLTAPAILTGRGLYR